MSEKPNDPLDEYRVPDSIEEASQAKLADIGLEDSRDGGTAKMLLRLRDSELQEEVHQYRNGDFTVYWSASNSPFDFPEVWEPNVEYFGDPSPTGVKVGFHLKAEFGYSIVSHTEDPNTWDSRHPKYTRAVQQSLRRIISSIESKNESPLILLPQVRAVRKSASEQQQRYAKKGNELLRKARDLLNGLVRIALHEAKDLPSTPDSYALQTYPVRGEADKTLREQRKRIAERNSPAFLFRIELERFWSYFAERAEVNWHFTEITKNLGIAEKVAKRYERILRSIERDLNSVDEHIVQSASLEIACTVIEAKIIEADRMPEVEEVMPDVGPTYYNRTIRAGKALRHYEAQEGNVPSFENYGALTDWLATHVPEQFGGREVGPTSYRNALKETGCWCGNRPGTTEGLEQTIQKTMDFAKDNIERGK